VWVGLVWVGESGISEEKKKKRRKGHKLYGNTLTVGTRKAVTSVLP